MLPRWKRVLSHVNRVHNFNKNTSGIDRRDLSSLHPFRSYAKVAAFTEPNVADSTHKSNSEQITEVVSGFTTQLEQHQVNLNKMFFSKPCSLALASDSPYRINTPQHDGIKRFLLKLTLFYSKQSQYIRCSNAIYRRITDQVDEPAIYDVFCLEKTFKTTFTLLIVHMWLCIRRLKEEGKEGKELGQYLYEIFNHDLELRVSREGVNLLLIKWMKELEKIVFGNFVAYEEAMGKENELENAIWRNIFLSDEMPSESSGAASSSKPSGDVLLPLQEHFQTCRALYPGLGSRQDSAEIVIWGGWQGMSVGKPVVWH